MGLESKCNKEKREFISKEQGGGQWVENYYEKTSGSRGILATLT